MIPAAKTIASVMGIGYIGKGAGTLASLIYCVIWLLVPGLGSFVWNFALLVLVLTAGVWSAAKVEKHWGHDSNRVVIDEWAGMMITLLMMPVEWMFALVGFVLFRFFDIRKPLGIRRAERLRGGWGVMADDVLAGVYAQLLLQIIVISST